MREKFCRKIQMFPGYFQDFRGKTGNSKYWVPKHII
jgi:hypothetical protein